MFKLVVSTAIVSSILAAAERASAADLVTLARAAHVLPPTGWAMLAGVLATALLLTRAQRRRRMAPRLTGGLISWAARQNGR